MSAEPPANKDWLVASLAELAGIAPTEAEHYLAAADWDLIRAGDLYFEETTTPISQPGMPPRETPSHAPNPAQPQPGGGRTLGGAYVPPTASSSSSSQRPAAGREQQRGLRTLGDLQSSGGNANGDSSSGDDDDSQDFFAGGEKSGIAVQNPNQPNPHDQVNNMLRRARQNIERPGGDDVPEPVSRFRGTGMTLGGDDAPSRAIPDPRANLPQRPPRVTRELHLWQDGFSVEDGELYRYDDPANARTLEMINEGHAPLSILDVQPGQEVDVAVHTHKDEKYVKQKKKYKPFSGAGQRVGSLTPDPSAPVPAPAASSSSASASATSAPKPTVDIDANAPTVQLQIRLADGTRLPSRFNTTHTIGDVYNFVDAASPASTQRPYALMTTFPSKELSDKSQVLGDLAEFKRGGVVVQKWT